LRLGLRTGSILVGLLWLSLALWVGTDLIASRAREIDNAQRTAGSLAKVLVGHLEATIDKVDLGLLEFAARYPQLLAGTDSKKRSVEMLGHYLSLFPEAANFLVADSRGDVIAIGESSGVASKANLADRDYFQKLRDSSTAGLVVSGPLVSRLN